MSYSEDEYLMILLMENVRNVIFSFKIKIIIV